MVHSVDAIAVFCFTRIPAYFQEGIVKGKGGGGAGSRLKRSKSLEQSSKTMQCEAVICRRRSIPVFRPHCERQGSTRLQFDMDHLTDLGRSY